MVSHLQRETNKKNASGLVSVAVSILKRASTIFLNLPMISMLRTRTDFVRVFDNRPCLVRLRFMLFSNAME